MAESNAQSVEIVVPEATSQTMFRDHECASYRTQGFGLDGLRCGVQTPQLAIFEHWTGVSGMERNDALKVTETKEKNEDRNDRVKRQEDSHELKRRTRMKT
jgi:hypothetical protein